MKLFNGGSKQPRKRRSRVLETERLDQRALLTTHAFANPALASIMNSRISTSSTTTSPATPTPTAREIARQHFSGQFQGTYLVGPGQYSNQAATIRIEAGGHSNQSFNANLQLILLTPLDQVNGTTTGGASVQGRNVATSGTSLVLDLTAPPTGRGGLPTTGTWVVNASSGGAYSSAGPFGAGSGTFKIRYVPSGSVPKGAHGAGRVAVVLQGMVYSSGVTNPIFGANQTPNKP